jgi:hypothetical protein
MFNLFRKSKESLNEELASDDQVDYEVKRIIIELRHALGIRGFTTRESKLNSGYRRGLFKIGVIETEKDILDLWNKRSLKLISGNYWFAVYHKEKVYMYTSHRESIMVIENGEMYYKPVDYPLHSKRMFVAYVRSL